MRKYELKIGEKQYTVEIKAVSSDTATVEVNGEKMQIGISGISQTAGASISGTPAPAAIAPTASAPAAAVAAAPPAAGDNDGSVRAPIPGKVLEVGVKTGDVVKTGTPLLKLEAMKMENEIKSPMEGTVAQILVGAGDSVAQGQEMVVIG